MTLESYRSPGSEADTTGLADGSVQMHAGPAAGNGNGTSAGRERPRIPIRRIVRETLISLLAEEREALFPEVGALAEELSALRTELGDFSETSRGAETAREQLSRELQRVERTLAGAVGKLHVAVKARLATVDQDLAALRAEAARQLAALEEARHAAEEALTVRDERLAKLVTAFERKLVAAGGDLRQGLDEAIAGLRAGEARLEKALRSGLSALGRKLAKVDGDLGGRVAAAEGELESNRREAREKIEAVVAGLSSLEETLRELADASERHREESRSDQSDREDRLRALVGETRQEVMEKLQEKLVELASVVERLSDRVAPRDSVERVDGRLERIERDLAAVSEDLDTVRRHTLDAAAAGETSQQVQNELTGLLKEANARENRTLKLREQLQQALEEVRDLMSNGLKSHDVKRALVRRRMLDLRDTVRGHLDGALGESDEPRWWGKGNREFKPSRADLERIRAVLAEVLESLEVLIFENTDGNGLA